MTTAAETQQLPRYRSHKIVSAIQIRAIDGNVIVPEEPEYQNFTVSDEYLAKHSPKAGGYFVQYNDGYTSFSPAEAFESGYTLITETPRKVKVLTVELENQIAIVCWENNRIYCGTIGDKPLPYWTDAPEGERQSYRNGISQLWTVLERGDEPSPEENHNNWLRQKQADGWTYGEKKDPQAKTHACFKPYNDLPLEQRMKYHLFINIVKAFFFAN